MLLFFLLSPSKNGNTQEVHGNGLIKEDLYLNKENYVGCKDNFEKCTSVKLFSEVFTENLLKHFLNVHLLKKKGLFTETCQNIVKTITF